MSIRPNAPAQSLKRHLSQSQDPNVGNIKRQRLSIDKSPLQLTYSDVAQTPGSSFTLADNLHSTNADTIDSSYTSLDPSPREPQDPYDDPYDDPEFDQLFESLTRPNSIDKSGTTPLLDHTDEFALKQSDQDALAEFLEEETWEEPQQPPSSVLRTWSPNSRSADEYDPLLQYSSPHPISDIPEGSAEYTPLHEGIDWSNVQEHTCNKPNPGSTANFTTANRSKTPENESLIAIRKPLVSSQSRSSAPTNNSQNSAIFTGKALLKPFKTFFDLQELLDAKAHMFRNQPDVTSEIGWGITVLEIRITTWKEIQGAMDTLGRKDLDEPGSSYGK
ncbi:hypothetical protein IL306_010362 [Fusarium sp. DS 682]|nr:hypothetical protein IL306_010362 [Fusarium sp. DS 682]